MTTDILTLLQPALLDLVSLVVSILLGFIIMRLPPALRTYVERNHRDALHQAAMTAARAVLDNDPNTTLDDALHEIAKHIHLSVPDAVAYLKPDPETLGRIAWSKIVEQRARL